MFSFVGETVLDPFLGSGTAMKVARDLKRNSIGYEINKDYLAVIKQKVGISKKPLFNTETEFEIIEQKRKKENLGRAKIKNIINNTPINNRINNPNYWKILRERKSLNPTA